MFDYLTFRGGKPDPSEQRKSSLFYMGVPQEKMKQLQIKTVNGRPNRHRNFLTRQYVSSLMKFVIFCHVISNIQRKYCSRKEQKRNPYQISSMERATQVWAETSIGGVVLSRRGMSRMISALQCKCSTRKPNVSSEPKTPLFIEWFSIWFVKPKPKTKAITLAYQYRRK